MENAIYIDFSEIDDFDDFYRQLKNKLPLPKYFGNNMDALADMISGHLKLPLHLEFVNMNLIQLDAFENLLELMEDMANEVDGFSFTYFLEIYDSDEEWDWIDDDFADEEE